MEKPSTFRSLWLALRSWRTASVVLLSFSSGLPLGLVWIAIPDWLAKTGMDIRLVGLITLAQAPWSFKFMWSPFMDRYTPPWLGRRRGWAAIAQVALFALTLSLAGLGDHPETPWVIGALAFAIAFASATQDIAIDAYAVDVLQPAEQGVAAGARIAVYRAAMYIAGALSITLAGQYSWPAVNGTLAFLYLIMLFITWKAPEPEAKWKPPASLKEAVWFPFLGFLSRHKALEILAFVIFYKFGDNLATALLRPFLVHNGSVIMMGPENQEMGAPQGQSPVTLYTYVENVDDVASRASGAGATIVQQPKDEFWGDRCCILVDPQGHSWMMATHVKDFSPEQMQENK